MSKGWVKLHRSLFDNDLWTAEPFTKGQAWIDLFANANHSPQSFWVREVEVRVDRGQLAWSEVTMAKRWQWSRGKVRRYLGMLKTRQMIEQQSDNVTSIITICNYRDFQDVSTASNTADGTADGTPSSTADGQQTVHKQECLEWENGKNVKEKDLPAPTMPDAAQSVFEYWCQRMDKNGQTKFSPKRRKAVQARLKDGRTVDDLMKAIDGCASSPFNMGLGERSDGTVYNDLELICRNNENLERFMQIYERPPVKQIANTNNDILGGSTW